MLVMVVPTLMTERKRVPRIVYKEQVEEANRLTLGRQSNLD